ncbi:MAG TPA: bifunctional YncE family protein/alkaline phosphatase family protein [Dinghuibacter sp.]|uniref:bifunctional YncE family protein/alkaline phosphatase family protein n=1 Tax=Dinghuibacter sp. TaxID=2024697 RepID=UPI002BC96B3C|nr:bifunctional YncE family protein/alkaline phosphatase family protein [Dinghuibacter sp.]HTJ14459.1 bifunctional YncE family protein/alkaline phosphatase family protein [Dinghuibacter sp.]
MKKHIIFLCCGLMAGRILAQTPGGASVQIPGTAGDRVLLPTGWYLSPAGKAVALTSDLPLNMAVAPDGVHLAVTNNGNGRQGVDLIDLKTGLLTDSVTVHASWLGLAFARRKPWLWVSGGNDDVLLRYTLTRDRLTGPDTLRLGAPWPKEKISPTGLALDESRDRLYVVTKEDDALYICDTRAMTVLRRVALSAEAYTCVYNAARHELYISGWGGSKVWIYSTVRDTLSDSVATEDHPNDMVLSRDGRWLYVANANANSVSVVDLAARKTVETLHTALTPDAPTGSTTNSVALGPGDKTLYIANADNNYLAVFDVSTPGSSRSAGFIPVGWYPTCVRTWRGGLLVADGKGLASPANPDAEGPYGHVGAYKTSHHGDQYIGSMLHGAVSMIPVPSPASLTAYTRQVYANTPLPSAPAGAIPPIRHVFYILKENRTYDQVLGDMRQGNGDSSLCIFGERVTPNAHALSGEFVLLDNFYVNAEVSADGHNWSMAGYATDFVEKNWPSNYAGRGGNYDFDGSRPIANPTKGFIWDYCARAGVSFRNYGEFEDNGPPTLPVLRDPAHYCRAYPGWNLDIQDVYRDSVFERDFDSLAAMGAVPRFSTIYLPNDHTSGLSRGAYTPIAHIADNDLALGRIVDHISHSPLWASSAIFVLEDDAQDGPDHVDAHRSVAYVISPYVRRHAVNHTLYSTAAMLRTMELILGLPPMSQYDAAAAPMFDCFTATADTTPYVFRPALVDINARNKAAAPVTFDFSKPDAAPDRALNEAIWQSVRGTAMPAPKRSAFVLVARSDDD